MNNPVPRVSAIITAYNSANFVADAIESVLSQTRPVDEIVVVDDGSTDNTPQIVARYAARGVRYIHQSNQGAGAARNRGLRETTGDLVAFLDSDDLWLPEKTIQQLNYLQAHPEVALVSGQKVWWDVASDRRWIKRYGHSARSVSRHEIVVWNFVGNPSMTLIWRSVLDQSGPFNPAFRWGQDWELWIRILCRANAEIAFLPDSVIVYRWHPHNLSHQKMSARLDSFFEIACQSINAYHPVWLRPLLLARVYSRLELIRAQHAYKLGMPWGQQIGYALRALMAYPFEVLGDKLKMLARVALGDTIWQRLAHASGLFKKSARVSADDFLD